MLDATLSVTEFEVSFGVISETGSKITWFEGPYEVTPGDIEQVINTENKTMKQNFTVKAIPQGYGKITYTGNTLGVE